MIGLDMSGLPVSGRLVGALVVWGGLCAFALGPLVATREIAGTGWEGQCQASLSQAIAARPAPSSSLPSELSCRQLGSMAGVFLGGDVSGALCTAETEVLIDGVLDLAGALDPGVQAQQQFQTLMQQDLAKAPSRCACAVQQVAAQRLSWGLYAGSGRFAGRDVSALQTDLDRALHQPACVFTQEG